MSEETGWLIERDPFRGRRVPTYLCALMSNHSEFRDAWTWTQETSEAIRFCRKQDAKAFLFILGLQRFTDLHVREHGWADMRED